MKGIYKITCIINNIIYIGSTSVDFIKRFRKHKQRLRHGYHENSYLQNAWNKYGEKNFTFEILEDLSIYDIDKIKEREGYWLSIYFPLGKNFCFNLSDHTGGGNTVKSEEIRKKLSDSVKKSYTPELRKIRSNHIKSRKDEIAKKLKETMKTEKWKQSHLEGVRKLAKNPEWLLKMKNINKYRQIKVYTDRGEEFESMTDASNKTGANKSNIRACIRGKIKTCKGRKWFYYNNNSQ